MIRVLLPLGLLPEKWGVEEEKLEKQQEKKGEIQANISLLLLNLIPQLFKHLSYLIILQSLWREEVVWTKSEKYIQLE